MVVVYNEEKARENKILYEKKRRSVSIILWILVVLGLLGMAAFVFAFLIDAPLWLRETGGALMILSIVLLMNVANSEASSFKPPPDVVFYLAEREQNKRMLNIKVQDCATHGLARKTVCLILENSDGTVETAELCTAKYQESTKVKRVEFNVNEGVIYVPYKLEKQEINKQVESDEN